MRRGNEYFGIPKGYARCHFLFKNASHAIHDNAIYWHLDAVHKQIPTAWILNELFTNVRHCVWILRVLPDGWEEQPLVLSLLQPCESKRELQFELHRQAIIEALAIYRVERKSQFIFYPRVNRLYWWFQAQVLRGRSHRLHGLKIKGLWHLFKSDGRWCLQNGVKLHDRLYGKSLEKMQLRYEPHSWSWMKYNLWK